MHSLLTALWGPLSNVAVRSQSTFSLVAPSKKKKQPDHFRIACELKRFNRTKPTKWSVNSIIDGFETDLTDAVTVSEWSKKTVYIWIRLTVWKALSVFFLALSLSLFCSFEHANTDDAIAYTYPYTHTHTSGNVFVHMMPTTGETDTFALAIIHTK